MEDGQQSSEFKKQLAAQLRVGLEMSEEGPSHVSSGDGWNVSFDRALAFLLDIVLLKFFCELAIWLLGQRLSFLGEDGWWVGLALAWIYFGFFDSRFGRGQTPGKRIVEIEVKRLDSAWLHPIDSLLRFVPFAAAAAAWFIARYGDPASFQTIALKTLSVLFVLGTVIFGLLHQHRRELHDLLIGSFVAKSSAICRIGPASVRRPLIAFAVACLIAIASAAALCWYSLEHLHAGRLSALREKAALQLKEKADHLNMSEGYSFGKDGVPARALIVTAHIAAGCKGCTSSSVANSIYGIVVTEKAIPSEAKQMTVTTREGYDLGLARQMSYSSHLFGVSRGSGVSGATVPNVMYLITPGKSRLPPKKAEDKNIKAKGK
ncbi:MAG: RDD family protein [Pseudomonadota bacterium]